jgi:hypothetical protein
MSSHNSGNNCIDYSTHFFFINYKSLIHFLRLNSSVGYQLLVGAGMEIVNGSLNTSPRLTTCFLCVAGQKGNTAQLQHMHTLLEITHDALTSERTMYYLTLVGVMDYL